LILGALALSQALWGWQLVGVQIGPGDTRAQGLYSHPLSFAYVCLIPFPLGVAAICRRPRQAFGWVVATSLLAGIVLSQSRTVQVVAAGVVAWNVIAATRGRVRLALLAGGAALAVGVLATPNRIGGKFRGMLSHYDVRSDYADDRLAFWVVNFSMWQERPLVGHGENLGTAYRTPYYEAAGLGAFERKYEAHNMYLQLAVNGGLIGLGLVLIWFAAQFRAAASLGKRSFAGDAGCQTLAAFCLAALTQNAFQDSAVRYVLALAVAALWLAVRDEAELT
jgi:O-antigen ligase